MGPFLLTHRVNRKDFLFDISSKLSPITIRDQMVRGLLVVEGALAENLIGPTKPLLIIGAGAAGATAALTAAWRGVPITLIDRSQEPFNRQLACDTRIISPFLYDWPAEHSEATEFPLTGVSFPFPWREDYAGPIAASWKAKLFAHERRLRNLTMKLGCVLEEPEKLKDYDPSGTGGLVEVNFVLAGDEKKPAAERRRVGTGGFSVIVSCVGWGEERSFAGTHGYVGENFWDSDKLTRSDYGVHWNAPPRLLISGGGDGALQDFLRVITRHDSVRDVLACLPAHLRVRLAAGIRTAEEQALRSYVWNLTRYDCRSQHLLHNTYKEVVKKILDDKDEYTAMQTAMSRILRDEPISLLMTHPCGHFSNSFALNRMLVLLIAEFLRRERGDELIEPYRKIVDVAGVDRHDCRNMLGSEVESERKRCRETPHVVTFGLALCEHVIDKQWSAAPDNHVAREQEFDVVVVRHGIIAPANPFFGAGLDTTGRHILPYFIEADWY